MYKSFSEYSSYRQHLSFLNECQLSQNELEILQFQVLDNLYNMMNIKEQEALADEHQILIQEFAFLIPMAANIAKSIAMRFATSFFVSKLTAKSKEEEKENEVVEKNVKKEGGILSMIYKAIKVLGITAFVASLIFVGFQFDAVRSMFPFLVPFMDKMTEKVSAFGQQAFMKLIGFFPWLGMWMAKKAVDSGLSAGGKALELAQDAADKTIEFASEKANDAGEAISDKVNQMTPQWIKDAEARSSMQRWRSPTPVLPYINPETGERSYPVDTRTGLRHGDYINARYRELENGYPNFKDLYDRFKSKKESPTPAIKLTPDELKQLGDWLK
jgi:hypothetical protein